MATILRDVPAGIAIDQPGSVIVAGNTTSTTFPIANAYQASANPTPEAQGREKEYGANFERDRNFSLAAASLRQALQDMPELTELSKHIVVEESKDGLNIEIVDQNGRSMFPEGSKEPNERMRRLISRIAGPLKATAFRISIAGHSSATRPPTQAGYGPWDLSADYTYYHLIQATGAFRTNAVGVTLGYKF